MIKNISYINIPSVANNRTIYKPAFKASFQDSFEKSNDTISDKIKFAKKEIIKTLETENIEHAFLINPDGQVFNNKGEDLSCTIDSKLIKPGAILIHGHPDKTPLSTNDVAFLLATDAISQEAIYKDGSSSKMTKKSQFKTDKPSIQVYMDLEDQLSAQTLDKLGIDYKTTKDDVIKLVNDTFSNMLFKDFSQLSYEEILKIIKNFGITPSDNPEEIVQDIKKKFISYQPYQDKLQTVILNNRDNIEQYLSTDEGILSGHKFWQNIADKYNLVYETDMI